jgi:hypothetical protein
MKIRLTREETKEIANLGYELKKYDYLTEEKIFCEQSKIISKKVPKRIQQLLKTFSVIGSPTGYIVFDFVEMQFDKIKTPQDNRQNIGGKTILACIQSILLNGMAEHISYEGENNGSLFQDIVPIKETERIQTSTGSKTELEIHTEQAFSPLKPDILSLACLNGDINAETFILTIDKVINNISLIELELLLKPLWMIDVDYSFKLNSVNEIRGPLSILNGSIQDLNIVFDQDLMKGLTAESDELIQKIVNIYKINRTSHNLREGEIMYIDNNRAVHGRSSFSPKYNENDRFLIRCFGTFDLKKSEYAREGRKVLSCYS